LLLRHTPTPEPYTLSLHDALPICAFPNARSVLNAINNVVSSAMYRFAPDLTGGELFDFYPVKIDRGSIRPGTVIYDPNGHVAVVDRKSTRLNSSHVKISYAVFCLK